MPPLNEISVNQLARLVGTPEAPLIFDVRIAEDVEEIPFLVPGATQFAHTDFNSMLTYARVEESPAVIICHKGKKLSQGIAALLRNAGIAAEFLGGGMVAWNSGGFPAIARDKIPLDIRPTLWVTRHRPKIDRIACPWLSRRYVDRHARFLYVSPQEVLDVADRFNAIPYDIEGVFWSHREEKCSFDVMIDEFNLHCDALDTMAKIIRGADTNKHDLAPECAGLLAYAIGVSRQFRNDNAQLDASMGFYDALYRWARDGRDETHDWPGIGHKKELKIT